MSVPSCPKRLNRCFGPTALVTLLAAVHPSARSHIPVTARLTAVISHTSHPGSYCAALAGPVLPCRCKAAMHLVACCAAWPPFLAVCNLSSWLEACRLQLLKLGGSLLCAKHVLCLCLRTTAVATCLPQLYKSLLHSRPAFFQLRHVCHRLQIASNYLCDRLNPLGTPLAPPWWPFHNS